MRKISRETREQQINDKLKNTSFSFVKWTDGFRDNKSRITLACPSHGEWSTGFTNFIRGTLCRKCHIESTRMSVEEVVIKIENNLQPNQTLQPLTTEYVNNTTKFNIECGLHGLWGASALHLIHSKSGCPKCGYDKAARGKVTPVDDVVKRVSKSSSNKGYVFKGFTSDYVNSRSKVQLECNEHGEWCTDINTVLSNKHGCPSCSKNGYDSKQDGTMYVLRSDCGGYFKAGISNNVKRRLAELKRVTPFSFKVISEMNNNGIVVLELERAFHSSFKSAKMKGFHGCTEWFVWSSEVYEWIILLSRP